MKTGLAQEAHIRVNAKLQVAEEFMQRFGGIIVERSGNKNVAVVPNSCAVQAVAGAYQILHESGAKPRVLIYGNADGTGRHAVTVFPTPSGNFLAYDEAGSAELAGITANSTSLEMARALFAARGLPGGKSVMAKFL